MYTDLEKEIREAFAWVVYVGFFFFLKNGLFSYIMTISIIMILVFNDVLSNLTNTYVRL